MKILISEIPDEGLELTIDEALESDVIKLVSPVKGQLSIRKIMPEVVIQGEITANAELECSRCLKNYSSEINAPIIVTYHPAGELKAEGKRQIREDELETGFYFGDELDLTELLKEQILLNVAMKPLCSETCKGICPKCGTDLNVNKCSCSLDKTDSRLEGLKELKELLRRE